LEQIPIGGFKRALKLSRQTKNAKREFCFTIAKQNSVGWYQAQTAFYKDSGYKSIKKFLHVIRFPPVLQVLQTPYVRWRNMVIFKIFW